MQALFKGGVKHMADISKITVSVIVDHTNRKTVVKRTGERTPISSVGAVGSLTLASAYRDVAAYFLRLAADQEGSLPEFKDQIAVMYHEHKLFNE